MEIYHLPNITVITHSNYHHHHTYRHSNIMKALCIFVLIKFIHFAVNWRVAGKRRRRWWSQETRAFHFWYQRRRQHCKYYIQSASAITLDLGGAFDKDSTFTNDTNVNVTNNRNIVDSPIWRSFCLIWLYCALIELQLNTIETNLSQNLLTVIFLYSTNYWR